jgi:heme-degrading monooxygenase HmoA
MLIAETPAPPYFAVIFTSLRTSDNEGYAVTAERMLELAAEQPGYLGVESVRDGATGLGITVSYWRDEESILAWKRNAEHREAQRNGHSRWYAAFTTRVSKVEREYGAVYSTGSSNSG